jgi:uncharacterized protein
MAGSAGEHQLQQQYGTATNARAFYDHQMLDHVNDQMRAFVARMEMVFIATADGNGECDASFRAGPPGFVRVLDDRTVAYPEYRGNGVMASLGNMTENPHVGLLFVDFFQDTVGLHINGPATIVENDELLQFPDLPVEVLEDLLANDGRAAQRWVVIEVVEAYIHCSKHIPLLTKVDDALAFGSTDKRRKGGDYFKAKHSARAQAATARDGA